MPDDYDWAAERMLAALGDALQSHGLGRAVGLLDPAVFPQHRGGVGVIVCCNGERPRVAALLQAMGCMVREHRLGIEGHLRNGTELGPAPPVPVTSADSARSAEGAAVIPGKRCCDCLNRFPAEAFNFISKATGRRSSYCKPCERRRCREGKARRTAARLEAV